MVTDVGLQSKEHRNLLDLIDKLRAKGVGEYVALPEIIVAGDQSAGKSSVLEAISGMSFPTKDNLCTRFATELVLRRSSNVGVRISIIPAANRPSHEQDMLKQFSPDVNHSNPELSEVVERAKQAMGINPKSKAFSDDILRVEISGPGQPHLTMVDLPGLFKAGNASQSVKDAQIVDQMVLRYMKRPRSIILAVVSAKSDFALQEVTRHARELDPQGKRTLGLITKPDTLDEGSESESSYMRLAQNKDVNFKLGWHVLKNRDYKMTRDKATCQERDLAEAEFFSKPPWNMLPPSTVGASSLKTRLSQLLKDQILLQLPDLIKEVENGVQDTKDQLEKLGPRRENTPEQRQYLIQISQAFSELIKAAVDGFYNDPFFGSAKDDEGYHKRLRAVIQEILTDFKDVMNDKGCRKKIIDDPDDDDPKENV